MFQLFKRKSYCLIAPINGTVISLDDVKDPVFAQRMMGDGVAIAASGDVVCAPADGIITVTIENRHAFGMCLDNGMEIIIHVGINTGANDQDAFEILIPENKFVTAGTPIIRIDRSRCHEDTLITPLIITNPECFQITNRHIGEAVSAAESGVIDYVQH